MLKKIIIAAIAAGLALGAYLIIQGDLIRSATARFYGCGDYVRDADRLVLTDMRIFVGLHGLYITDDKCKGRAFSVSFLNELMKDRKNDDFFDRIFSKGGSSRSNVKFNIIANFKSDSSPYDEGSITVLKITKYSNAPLKSSS